MYSESKKKSEEVSNKGIKIYPPPPTGEIKGICIRQMLCTLQGTTGERVLLLISSEDS